MSEAMLHTCIGRFHGPTPHRRRFFFAAAAFLQSKHTVVYCKYMWLICSLMYLSDVGGIVIYLDWSFSDGTRCKLIIFWTKTRCFSAPVTIVVSFRRLRHFWTGNTQWSVKKCVDHLFIGIFFWCRRQCYISGLVVFGKERLQMNQCWNKKLNILLTHYQPWLSLFCFLLLPILYTGNTSFLYHNNLWIMWSLIYYYDVGGNVLSLDWSFSDKTNFKWINVGTKKRWFSPPEIVVASFLLLRHSCTSNARWCTINICESPAHWYTGLMSEAMLYIYIGRFRIR
jgi:hypothetical protein